MSFTDPYRVHANRGNGPEPALLLDWLPAINQQVGQIVATNPGHGLVVFGDGEIEELGKEWVTLDFRYDPTRDIWVDGTQIQPTEDELTPDV